MDDPMNDRTEKNGLPRGLRPTMKDRLKWMIFPGVNLHARLRYKRIGGMFQGGGGNVLDAGSGNGMLAYRAYQKGNTVLGVTFRQNEVDGATKLFNGILGIPATDLKFVQGNLYALDLADDNFSEIVCAEVLEHLRGDDQVCATFWRLLKPGGVLHVCVPNADHPYNASFPLDENERGGHVRPGYTLKSLKELLEPLGFIIVDSASLGGPVRQYFNRLIKESQQKFGAWIGVPLFFVSLPLLLFDSAKKERGCPFSIYVRAVKK